MPDSFIFTLADELLTALILLRFCLLLVCEWPWYTSHKTVTAFYVQLRSFMFGKIFVSGETRIG
jgi:hypothetical protein